MNQQQFALNVSKPSSSGPSLSPEVESGSKEEVGVRRGFLLERPEIKTKQQLLSALRSFIRETSSIHLYVVLEKMTCEGGDVFLSFKIMLICREDPFLNHWDRIGKELCGCSNSLYIAEPFYDRIKKTSSRLFLQSTIDFNNYRSGFTIEFPNTNFSFKKPVTDLTSNRGALIDDGIRFNPQFSLPFPISEIGRNSMESENGD
jgi:hypothetical protein